MDWAGSGMKNPISLMILLTWRKIVPSHWFLGHIKAIKTHGVRERRDQEIGIKKDHEADHETDQGLGRSQCALMCYVDNLNITTGREE